MTRPPARPARLLRQPFRASDAIAAGLLTSNQIRSTAWRRLFRGVYVSAALPDSHVLRVKGAALLLPDGAAVTGRSAALIWDARMGDIDTPVEVVCSRQFGPVRGLSITKSRINPDEMVVRKGVPVITMPRTAWELARRLPELDAVAWVDALAHTRRISTPRLLAEAGRHLGQRGADRAIQTLALCDWRAESPPESHLRVHIRKSRLPQPIPQHDVVHDGYLIARVDFGWPKLRFAVEYDGQWHVDPAQLADDRDRIRALQRAGWAVHPVTRRDMRDVPTLIDDLRRALKQREADLVKRP